MAITEKYYNEVTNTKQLIKDIDILIQRAKELEKSRETSLAITKLQEGVTLLGIHLKELGGNSPYLSSKDPTTGTRIEPTADGLKL